MFDGPWLGPSSLVCGLDQLGHEWANVVVDEVADSGQIPGDERLQLAGWEAGRVGPAEDSFARVLAWLLNPDLVSEEAREGRLRLR